MPNLKDRLVHAWNAFTGTSDEPKMFNPYSGIGYSYRPDRRILRRGNEKSIVTAIYNRIAMDCAAIDILHCRLDDDGKYKETINSGLNNALTVSANVDQTGRQLVQDIVLSLCDEGVVAVVPTDTTLNPRLTGGYDILELRVGKIKDWYPSQIRVELYNEKTGKKEEIVVDKSYAAIIENPFYSVMNEPNSTVQRLIRKLNILDSIDEQSASGKLDLIIQLPYQIKSDARRQQAEMRRKDIEMQLSSSKFGIAYTDGTEHVTQLNRPIENNMMASIEYLTSMLYSQLGINEAVLNGTATPEQMNNYYTQTIEHFMTAIVEEYRRKFLTKTAITQKQSIIYLRDPFKLIPIGQIADMADKFTRNEILSSNEFRAIIGRRPSDQPGANDLRNKNINQSSQAEQQMMNPYQMDEERVDV